MSLQSSRLVIAKRRSRRSNPESTARSGLRRCARNDDQGFCRLMRESYVKPKRTWSPGRESKPALPLTRRLHRLNACGGNGGKWCWFGGSNTAPAVYETAALPTELNQREKRQTGAFAVAHRLYAETAIRSAPNFWTFHDAKHLRRDGILGLRPPALNRRRASVLAPSNSAARNLRARKSPTNCRTAIGPI